MSRFGMQIHQVHIVDGFVDDCDELLHHCRQVGNLTYDTFTEIWKGMGFAYLYRNRASHVEVAEMSEELLHVAKRYMVVNTSNYEDSVMGLFLVYALLHLQPYRGFASLRITPDDVPAIARIESVARRDRRFDVLRVLGSVLIEGPCIYTVVDRARGMETGFRKYYEGYTSMDSQGIRPKGVFYRQNTELDLIREMITLDKRYSEAKKFVTGVKSDASLSYTDSNLPQVLESSLKKVINGLFVAEERASRFSEKDKKETKEPEERHDVVQQIKMKAMKATVDTMSHLHGIQERTEQKRTERNSIEINKEGGNVKSSSPKKTIKSGSPRKRKATKAVSSKNKKVKTIYEEHLDDSFESLDLSSSHNDPITDEEDLLSPEDLELKKVDNSNANDNIQLNCEKTNTIGLESLPILVSTGNNEYIQIEVIDEANPSNNLTESHNTDIKKISKSEIAATDNLAISSYNEYIEIEVVDELCNNEMKINADNSLKNTSKSKNLAPVLEQSNIPITELRNEEILKRINELPHLSIERVAVKDLNPQSKASVVLNSFKNDDELFKKPRAVKNRESISKSIRNKRDQKKHKPKLKKPEFSDAKIASK